MSSSTKREKLQIIISAAIILIIAAVSFIIHLWINSAELTAPTAQIYQNGELLHEIPLSESNSLIEIGNTNKIEICDGKIGMTYAACPDKTCINTGFINGVIPIICIPNRIEIRIINRETAFDFDAVTY